MSERVVVAGVPFAVRPAAGKPSLLLLHGFTGAPASWDEVAELLAGRAAVAAPFLPGHDGRTGWFAGADFEQVADAIAAALPGLAAGPWHLAGYSLGGRVALALLARHGALFASALLIGASAGLRSEQERRERRAADARWAAMLRTQGLAAFLAAWREQPLFASQRELPTARAGAQEAIGARHDAEALARSLEVLGLAEMPDLWPALSEMRLPVRVMAGARDGKFSRLAEAMAAALPRATLSIVPGVGHNVVLEAPEAVAAVLAATVSATPAGGQEVV